MRTVRLKNIILIHRFYAILFLAACFSVFGFFLVKKYIVGEAQRQVKNDLRTVRFGYQNQFAKMNVAFEMLVSEADLDRIKQTLDLDYVKVVAREDFDHIGSDVVRRALDNRCATQAPRIIPRAELAAIKQINEKEYAIDIQKTPKARPTDKRILENVMAMEYARPIFNRDGRIDRVVYGGKIINKNEVLIDEIVNSVFEKRMYRSKPLGTVTIFQDDVRIATNVLGPDKHRAVGTRVSQEVYQRVIEEGQRWYDRAFVVTDWYITAYEPIRDVKGQVIGILYVGILEQPFMDMGREIFMVFLVIILLTSLLAGGLSIVLAKRIHRPLTKVVRLTREIADGKWDSKVDEQTPIVELNELIDSFHHMAERLEQRENSLAVSKKKLEDLNKDYLELVGFVSHELKGILSSIVLNTYLLSNKVLGEINQKQATTLHSMARNLDYLSATVRNFLNLSRIEKGELAINKIQLPLKAGICQEALEAFGHQAQDKGMAIEADISDEICLAADPELMQIVINNLLSNAVKYGAHNGRIKVSAQSVESGIMVEVYNDGRPIVAHDIEKLFKKFSRLTYEGMEKVKGTGVGLYITKEIIERHGGRIWIETSKSGNYFKFVVPKA